MTDVISPRCPACNARALQYRVTKGGWRCTKCGKISTPPKVIEYNKDKDKHE